MLVFIYLFIYVSLAERLEQGIRKFGQAYMERLNKAI